MGNEEIRRKLAPYAGLVQTLWDLYFFHLDRKLTPSDFASPDLMPREVRSALDDVLYGGKLFECQEGYCYEIATSFGVEVAALQLPQGDGFVVIGPYLSEQESSDTVEVLLARNGVPLARAEEYRVYYQSVPVLESTRLQAVMNVIMAGLYNAPLACQMRAVEVTPENPPPCPVFEEDAVQLRAAVLERRYAQENRFLERVARGDYTVLNSGVLPIRMDRAPNRLRNEKNLTIILNTLLRKSLEKAQVHPYYLDAISTKWALRIEAVERVGEIPDLRRDMVRDYCRHARKHSLASYTPNVRAMMNFVHFNLGDPELSLGIIAGKLGVNASYLSQQFNREVGKSLPSYVAECRIAEAKKLLRTDASLPVGYVATAVGFSDVNYFAKVFKKHTGQTPTAYRAGDAEGVPEETVKG